MRLSLCIPSPSSAACPPPPLSGFVAKRSHGRFWQKKKDWKEQWAVLDCEARALRLYADSEVLRHPELPARRLYSLLGAELMVKDNENRRDEAWEGKAAFSFHLILKDSGRKKIELGFESRERRQTWVDALQRCQQQQTQAMTAAAAKASTHTPSAAADAAAFMSPPRPPKKPATAAFSPSAESGSSRPTAAAAAAAPLSDRSNVLAIVPADRQRPDAAGDSELKPAGAVSSAAEETDGSMAAEGARPPPPPPPASYLSKAIAAGTAVQLMPGRQPPALPPAPAQTAAAPRPALPASTPRTARATPAQSPPPPPPPAAAQHPAPEPPTPTVAVSAKVQAPLLPPPASALLPAPSAAPPAPLPGSSSELVSALLSHHSCVAEAAAAVGSLGWDEELQSWLRKARSGSASINSSVVCSSQLLALLSQFRQRCLHWARVIVEEYSLPCSLKSVRPVREEAEREKQQFVMEGIGFSFAQAGEEDEERGLQQDEQQQDAADLSISAARLADQLAYKQATHELHALSALQAAALPAGLCLPLMATVDYIGFRVKAVATLPVYDSSPRLWGRSAAAPHSLANEPSAAAALSSVASQLNLAAPLSQSLQIHAGSSGDRLYLSGGLSSLYPVDLDVKYASSHGRLELCWQSKVFRREFVSNYTQQLSSDVYATTSRRMMQQAAQAAAGRAEADDEEEEEEAEDDEEEAEARAAEASKFLQETIIPRFIKQLDRLTGGSVADVPDSAAAALTSSSSPSSSPVFPVFSCSGACYLSVLVDGGDLCRLLHAHGINLRYLGRVAELSKQAYVRQLCAVEMVARTCKTLLAQNLRTLQRTVVSTESCDGQQPLQAQEQASPLSASSLLLLQHSLLTRLKEGAVDFMNLVLGRGEESDQFWSLLLYPDVCIKFSLAADSPVSLRFLRGLHLPLLHSALQQRCGLACVEREYEFGLERPIAAADFLSFAPHCKQPMPQLAVDGYVHKARAAVLAAREADRERDAGRDWQRFASSVEIQLTMRGWKAAAAAPAAGDGAAAVWPAAGVEVGEARRRLRLLNELTFAYLQTGDRVKAERSMGLATSLAASLAYSPGFSCLPREAAQPRPPSFGPHAEHARLLVNGMWLTMAAAAAACSSASPSSPLSGDEERRRGLKRTLTSQYQAAVAMLNYHVGLLHPVMLSLHFALAAHHLLQSPPPGPLSASSPLFVLLLHCHQFSAALFSSRKPLTFSLALLLADAHERAGDAAQAGRWLQTALDGINRALDAGMKGGRQHDDAERLKLRDKRDWAVSQLKRLQEAAAAAGSSGRQQDEEKEQSSLH